MATFQVETDRSERNSYRFVPYVLALASAPFGYGHRYGICFIPSGDEGRQKFQGPMVPGPWAKTYGLSTVIAANPEMGTGAEIRRNRAAGLEFTVADGDEIVLTDRNVVTRFRVTVLTRPQMESPIRLDVIEPRSVAADPTPVIEAPVVEVGTVLYTASVTDNTPGVDDGVKTVVTYRHIVKRVGRNGRWSLSGRPGRGMNSPDQIGALYFRTEDEAIADLHRDAERAVERARKALATATKELDLVIDAEFNRTTGAR